MLPALPRREVVLRCRGGDHGAVVNARLIRRPRHRTRCQRPGQRVVHVWDARTGRPVRDEYEPLGGVIPPEEETDGWRIR